MTRGASLGINEFFQEEGRLRQERQRYKLAIPKYQGIQTLSQAISHAIVQDAQRDAKDIFRKSQQELRAIVRAAIRDRLLYAETIEEFIDIFQDPDKKSYFISKPEAKYDVAGSYFAEHQYIRQEDQSPEVVLLAYKESLIKQAEDWKLDKAVKELKSIDYAEEVLAEMPEKVASLGAVQNQLGIEAEVEQEEDIEHEQEEEQEGEQVRTDQRLLGTYPLRERNTEYIFHHVAEKIHPAYSPLLQVTDNFLPFSRIKTGSLHQRRPFDETMYRIGVVYLTVSEEGIERVVIDDFLEDDVMASNKVIYDIRTNRAIKGLNSENPNHLSQLPNFFSLVAQIKFLDGQTTGYSADELRALEAWLRENDSQKMRDHLLNDILRCRYQDQQAFLGSQLQQLFDKLNREQEIA